MQDNRLMISVGLIGIITSAILVLNIIGMVNWRTSGENQVIFHKVAISTHSAVVANGNKIVAIDEKLDMLSKETKDNVERLELENKDLRLTLSDQDAKIKRLCKDLGRVRYYCC